MNPILNYTLACPSYDLTDFLRFGVGLPRFYFESQQSSLAFAGLGIAAQILRAGEGRFAALAQEQRRLFQRVIRLNGAEGLPGPILLAGASFFPQMRPGEWDSFPAAALILPRYALMRISGQTFFCVNQIVAENEAPALAAQRLERKAQALLAQFQSASFPEAPLLSDLIDAQESSRADWQTMLEQAIATIGQGALQKVVLARATRAQLSRPPDLGLLLAHLGATCPDCFRFLFEFLPGAAFAGATPERLISVHGRRFETAALAGSIRRGDSQAEDEALKQELYASAKDQSEHAFVLDEIRARLAPLADDLQVGAAPQILQLPNIQHLRTPIAGNLRPGLSVLDGVAALHPTPAVGGLPLAAALQFLQAQEGFERGWYAAPVGWLDQAGNGDFAVAIRSGLFRGHEVTLFGGAGIVAHSQPQKEWDETGLKMRFLLNALQGQPV